MAGASKDDLDPLQFDEIFSSSRSPSVNCGCWKCLD